MQFDGIQFSARVVFGLCSLGLLAAILTMVRHNAIKEKYALLWLPLGFAFLMTSLFPELLLKFSARMHLHYMTVVVLCVIVVFTNILLYFTVKMSQLREDVKKLSQEIALSRARESAPAAPAASKSASTGWVPVEKKTGQGA